ncbi:MAG: hypothetical protein QOD89_1896 [Bradyrhizobium sp.]|jgi:hypothetical protein|nr:hypothetical protein [Bradyrhizobium sp.]
MTRIEPKNLTAQLHYRGRGNPPNSQPVSAISNCYPGLEMDFRAIWRRMFVGIVLVENNNYVLEADPGFEDLVHHRLLLIEDFTTGVATTGVVNPGFPPAPLSTGSNPNGVSFMEWSNSLARILAKQGQKVRCGFTAGESDIEVLFNESDKKQLLYRDLEVRRFFEVTDVAGQPTPQPVIARALADPGELTQGLCSPWQNDYRECACYYWAASRPDYVNVVDTASGETRGDNWMGKITKTDARHYVLDDRSDPRLQSYDDLFRDWQGVLRFIVGGSNAQDNADREDGG